MVNHLLLPWHPLETPDAVDFLEKYLGTREGSAEVNLKRRFPVAEAVSRRMQPNLPESYLAVDLNEHARETIERGIHTHERDEQLFRQPLKLHRSTGRAARRNARFLLLFFLSGGAPRTAPLQPGLSCAPAPLQLCSRPLGASVLHNALLGGLQV